MEFKEVEGINKEAILKIKDRIHLRVLLPYMETWGFSTMVIQGIEADLKNLGESYAVMSFLDAVKKRPGSFPKIMSALLETEQFEIRQVFRIEIRKYFKNKQKRLTEVLSLIEVEERELGFCDPITLMEYEMAIKDGKEDDRNIRLMIIGCYEQGKTTLARRLLGQTLEGIESTNGIDIHKVACTQDGNMWESIEEDDIVYESMERLALIQEVRNEETLNGSNQDQAVGETADSDDIDTAHGLASSLPVSKPRVKRADLVLYQKIKRGLRENEHDDKRVLSLWDFGGQFVFYSTHQLFHSRYAVYLLVFDLHKDLDSQVYDEDYPGGTRPFVKSMRDYIEFWVTSVHCFVGSRDATRPKIILVGTHKDKLKDENVADDYFDAVKQMFDGRKLGHHIHPDCFAIAGTDLSDDTVARLRETVMVIGKEIRQEIPAIWIPLEMELRKREHENILKFEEVTKINKSLEHPIGLEGQIKAFLKFHHAKGTFIYFDEGEMANHVVINPPFIVDAFRCIITSGRFCKKDFHLRPLWKKLTADAILEPELIHAVWEGDPGNRFFMFKDVLVSVLQKQRIIAETLKFNEESQELMPLGYYIVPSFLRKTRGSEVEAFLEGRTCTAVSLVYVFEHEAIVSTIFQRITAAGIGSWPVVNLKQNKLQFENAVVYRLDLSYAGVILHCGGTIEIFVVHMCPGNTVSPEIPDFFRRFVENIFKNEFRKLLRDDRDNEDTKPFSTSLRCYHKAHKCKGSVETYELEMLKTHQEKEVCCPDNLAHDGIYIQEIFHEWFGYKFSDKVIPHRRLEPTEFVELSSAIGYEWQSLGTLLGIDKIRMEHIDMDYHTTSMKIHKMLMVWDKEKSDEATLDTLVKAVDKLPKGVVNLDIIKNLIDKIY